MEMRFLSIELEICEERNFHTASVTKVYVAPTAAA